MGQSSKNKKGGNKNNNKHVKSAKKAVAIEKAPVLSPKKDSPKKASSPKKTTPKKTTPKKEAVQTAPTTAEAAPTTTTVPTTSKSSCIIC